MEDEEALTTFKSTDSAQNVELSGGSTLGIASW